MKTLRLVLRSTVAIPVTFLAAVVCEILFLTGGSRSWQGEYALSVEWIGGNLIPALVIAAVAIGVDCTLALAPHRRHLVFWGNRRGAALGVYLLLEILALWVPFWASMAYAYRWWTSLIEGSLNAALLHALAVSLTHAVIVALCVAVGLVVGRAAVVVVPVVAVVLGYCGLGAHGVLATGGIKGTLVGYRAHPPTAALRVIVLAVCLVILVALAVAAAHRWRRSSQAITAVVAVGLVASTGASLQQTSPDPADQLTCIGRDVCLDGQHRRLFDSVAYGHERILHAADTAGLGDVVPRRLVERIPLTDPFMKESVAKDRQMELMVGPDVAGWVASPEDLNAELPADTSRSIIYAMSSPSHCEIKSAANPPERLFDAQQEAAEGLTAAYEGRDVNLPVTRAAFEDIRSCSFDG